VGQRPPENLATKTVNSCSAPPEFPLLFLNKLFGDKNGNLGKDIHGVVGGEPSI
jgi:hypothetical protein